MAAPVGSSKNDDRPASNAQIVVVDVVLKTPARGLYVGVGGDVELDMEDGSTVLFVGVLQGTILPVRFLSVNSNNTTATTMVALF